MEHYLLLKIAHALPAVLLLLGLPAHAFMLRKAARSGDAALLQRKLRITCLFSLPAFALLALSLPVSGWWLVDLAGFPLGQTWLLASSGLFVLLLLFGLLLHGRLRAWRALAGAPAPRRLLQLCAVYAGILLALLLAISALMGAKPL